MRREQRILKRVGRLVRVTGGAQRDSPKSVAMAPDQRRERHWVTGHMCRQQVGVRSGVFGVHGRSVFTGGYEERVASTTPP